MAEGWIKLHRELVDKPIWQCSTPEQKTILITILMLANHQQKEWEWNGKKYTCGPGEFITSLDSLSKKCGVGVSTQNVRTALTRFKNYEFLTYQSTKTGRLISVVNWGLYQSQEDEPNKAPNKRLTKTQQRPNKDLTTNKNVRMKECKNDKEIKDSNSGGEPHRSTKFTPPTLEEVKTYCTERKNNINPESFIDFYSSKNWMIGKNKMKDWKAAIRTWEKRQKEYGGGNSGGNSKRCDSNNGKATEPIEDEGERLNRIALEKLREQGKQLEDVECEF